MTYAIGINDYPSPTVRNFPMKRAFLIDCDGGLGSAFNSRGQNDITSILIEKFPPNSDIFLFLNNNDANIVKRMKELKSYYFHVQIYTNITESSKYGVDMNLSFVLGAINDRYDNYIIIARRDRAYEEIKQRLESTNPRLKNHVELRQFAGPEELTQYIRQLVQTQVEPHGEQLKSSGLAPTVVKFTPEKLFHRCPLDSPQKSSRLYRFAELLDHFHDEHPEIHYEYCRTCEQMVQENNWSRDQAKRFNKHIKEYHLDNKAGFHLSIRSRQDISNCEL